MEVHGDGILIKQFQGQQGLVLTLAVQNCKLGYTYTGRTPQKPVQGQPEQQVAPQQQQRMPRSQQVGHQQVQQTTVVSDA